MLFVEGVVGQVGGQTGEVVGVVGSWAEAGVAVRKNIDLERLDGTE